MRRAFKDGYHFTASFDLTACYDSIDHGVLRHFLDGLGVSAEVSALLCTMLTKWTDSGLKKPIHHGHGIPQGPVPSGLFAEVVLSHFDSTAKKRGLRYFRYVDDIRLFARDELTLRQELIALDIKSKEVGLFPQSSKVSIHRVTNIEDEIKGISQPFSTGARRVVDQAKLKKALVALSPRFAVENATQFKYDLGSAEPDAQLVLLNGLSHAGGEQGLIQFLRDLLFVFRLDDHAGRLARPITGDLGVLHEITHDFVALLADPVGWEFDV